MFIHEKNKDYKIVIKFPTIEYLIQSKQFVFIKTLSRSELSEYLNKSFAGWEESALRHFMQYRKFVELLKHVPKVDRPDTSHGEKMQVYVL